jgi:5-carboxymethyl-2-hydroxymuconate isomerase
MPHIIVEQSADVKTMLDPQVLCKLLFEAAFETGVFASPAAIKVRVHTADAVLMGTDIQSFVHAKMRMLAGRTNDEKTKVTSALLAILTTNLPDVGNLSVDICDLHDSAYTKRVL